jgi:molybdate transport system substrate-binding protein
MKRFAWALLTLGAPCATLFGADTTVAVAANFSEPMQKIAAAFARDTGHRALLAVGSTGKLSAQIRNGAPFDALLAADEVTPRRLIADGLADPASLFTYATGRLALWSAQPGLVDARGAVLQRGSFRRLALADPQLAPYGAAALDVLSALKLEGRLRQRLVLGESVGQAYLFVASGNAPLGFVALSQVQLNGRLRSGSAWIVPQSLHRPIRQDFVLLAHGKANVAARALAQYLRGSAAHRIIRSHGYD